MDSNFPPLICKKFVLVDDIGKIVIGQIWWFVLLLLVMPHDGLKVTNERDLNRWTVGISGRF